MLDALTTLEGKVKRCVEEAKNPVYFEGKLAAVRDCLSLVKKHGTLEGSYQEGYQAGLQQCNRLVKE